MRWVLRHAVDFEVQRKRKYKWCKCMWSAITGGATLHHHHHGHRVLISPHQPSDIFADDDVYFRAPALVALLSQHDHTKPLAFTGASGSRG